MERVKRKAEAAGFHVSDPVVQAQLKRELDNQVEANPPPRDRERAVELLKESGAPSRHRMTAAALRGDAWLAKFEGVAARLGSGFLIAFIGGRGPGKTQMGVELIKLACNALMSARYATAMEFFIEVKGAYRDETGAPSERLVIDRYTRPRLLVLDEIQERGATPWEDRLLTHLVDTRYRENRDTVLIGNLTSDELASELGKSIVSRLVETGGIVEFDWPSFRQPKDHAETKPRPVAKKKGGK